MNKITLVTDDAGNVVGGSLAASSDRNGRTEFSQTIVALDGQRLHEDVELPTDLLSQEDNESLVKELLNRRIDDSGNLVRKG